MTFDDVKEIITPYATHLAAPNGQVLVVDTRTSEGRAFMRDMLRASRRERELAGVMGRVRSAWGSYRKTQANDRRGERGYFLNAAEARAYVRLTLAQARAAVCAFDRAVAS